MRDSHFVIDGRTAFRTILAAALLAAAAVPARPTELEPDPPDSYRKERGLQALQARDAAWLRVASLKPTIAPLFYQGIGQTSIGRTSGGSFGGGTVPGATVFTPGIVTFGTAQDAANAVMFNETAGCITAEGATADAFETRICFADVGADQTITFPSNGGGASNVVYQNLNQTMTGQFTFNAQAEFSAQTNISGPDATTNVEIGSTANDANGGTGGTAVAIGNGATNSGNGAGNIAIGSLAATPGAGANQISIGPSAGVSNNGNNASIVIGGSSSAGGGITIGNSTTGATTPSTVIAHSGTGIQNAFLGASDSYQINDVYFGRGSVSTVANANGQLRFRGTGGSGSNNAGGNVSLIAGLGTGTAAGGDVNIQRSPSIATGSTAQTAADAIYIRSQMKALTAATATAFARVNLASGVAAVTGWTGGTIFYTLVANDASDFQSRSGSINFAVVNKAGTETCAVGTVTNEPVANSASTTTLTFDTSTAPTNGCDIRATGDSALTETTLALFWTAIMNGPGTITPQ